MRYVTLIIFIAFSASALAREPYHATVTVDTEMGQVSAPNLVDLTKDLRTKALELLVPLYTPTSPVSIDINLRGILAQTSFAANSNDLVVQIPQARITQTFSGATREDSLKLFKEFIRDGGDRHRLLRAYAKYSPIDPIAGNPNSLMAAMAEADYRASLLSPLAGCNCGFYSQPIPHQFNIGLDVLRGFSEGFDTTSVTIPLRYSYAPKLTWAFILDAPLTYNRNGGASSVFGSVGIGLQYPVTMNWSLTPLFRMGAGGSLDLCTAGSFASFGLASIYRYKLGDFVLTLTNYADCMTSVNFWLSGIDFNYHLSNGIFKNGLSFTSCNGYVFCNRALNFSLSIEDSYFTGHRLYIQHYDEVNFSLIINDLNPCLNYDCLSLSFAYQFGEKSYKGYRFDANYQF